jgi:hypothetical protein
MTSGVHAASSKGESHCQSVAAVAAAATKKAAQAAPPPKKRGKVPVLSKAEEQEVLTLLALLVQKYKY